MICTGRLLGARTWMRTRTRRLAIHSASLMPYKSWMRAAIVGAAVGGVDDLHLRPFGN